MSEPNHSILAGEVYIVAAKRSPIGRMSGSLSGLAAHQLGGQVIRSLLKSVSDGSSDPVKTHSYLIEHLKEVIVGQVFTTSTGPNPARQAAHLGGVPFSVPSWTVNMMCGSGLKAVCLAYDNLKVNSGGWIIAGGQESMSQSPHACPAGAAIRRGGGQNTKNLPHLGNFHLVDTLMTDGLIDAFTGQLMGETAEFVASKFGITRMQQDQFSLMSQHKYAEAKAKGYFDAELMRIQVAGAKKDSIDYVLSDEHPRPDSTIEALTRLRPAFKNSENTGTVTAGNSSGVNDGAAYLMLCRGEELLNQDLPCPIARIVGHHQVGVEPQLMGLSPIRAVQGLLDQLHWDIESVDLFELNEAFAALSVSVIDQLAIPAEKVNVVGGAIALGHPLGCTGARILVTLVHALQRLKISRPNQPVFRGVAALCIGGGMGIAMAIESV